MNWYCLRTETTREMAVAMALGDVGCGVYVPTQWLYRARRGSKRQEGPLRVAQALLPGYFFANAESDDALFDKLVLLSRCESYQREGLREALLAAGQPIEDGRLARAASPRWKRSGVHAVLSYNGRPAAIPQGVIDAIVRMEVERRFVPAPPVDLILSIGDRVTVRLGPDGASGVVMAKPRQGQVSVNISGERRKVPVSSVRLAA